MWFCGDWSEGGLWLATCVQALTTAVDAETRYAPLPAKADAELVAGCKVVLAKAYATISEGLLLTAMLDKKLTDEVAATKLKTQLDRTKKHREELGSTSAGTHAQGDP